jgi:hypothetical protein
MATGQKLVALDDVREALSGIIRGILKIEGCLCANRTVNAYLGALDVIKMLDEMEKRLESRAR